VNWAKMSEKAFSKIKKNREILWDFFMVVTGLDPV
jgi:hypothetical protein